MVEEARLEEREGGLTPVSGGWFVVNVRDGAWVTNGTLGDVFVVEGDDAPFPDIGFSLAVFQPGQTSRYHREANQEDFLVLAGECLLLIEGEERPLKAWDFVHCPPDTEHAFVGAGDGLCAVGRLTHHLAVVGRPEQHHEAGAHQLLVVGHYHADHDERSTEGATEFTSTGARTRSSTT